MALRAERADASTAPRIRRLRRKIIVNLNYGNDSSAHTEIKGALRACFDPDPRQLRAYGD